MVRPGGAALSKKRHTGKRGELETRTLTGRGYVQRARSWIPPKKFDSLVIVRPLGSGGMGKVYLARDIALDREVAVKFVRDVASESRRERLLVEGRALAQVTHTNVATIYRMGQV